MSKSVLAAVFALLLSAAVVQADYVVSHNRVENAVINGSTFCDVITWSVTNDGRNGTGSYLTLFDVALFDQFGGMLIGTNAPNHPDVFGVGAANQVSQYSHLDLAGGTALPAQSVLNGNLTYTIDAATNPGNQFSGVYADRQDVAGIAGTVVFGPLNPIDINPADGTGAALAFAQTVVRHGDTVVMLAPGNQRFNATPPNWEPAATSFGESTLDSAGHEFSFDVPVFDSEPIPEPGSLLAALPIAVTALVRRRSPRV